MKRYLLILIFFFTGFSLYAQDDETDQRMGVLQEKMQLYIQKRLNMTRAESERFSPIFLRYISELRRTHRENKLDRPMMQLKIAELRVRYRDEFRKVIDEQRANRVFQHQHEFEIKIMQEIKERRMQERQGPKNRIRAMRF
jgi:hypothetical protein